MQFQWTLTSYQFYCKNTEYTIEDDAIAFLWETIDRMTTKANEAIQEGSASKIQDPKNYPSASHCPTHLQSHNGWTASWGPVHTTWLK